MPAFQRRATVDWQPSKPTVSLSSMLTTSSLPLLSRTMSPCLCSIPKPPSCMAPTIGSISRGAAFRGRIFGLFRAARRTQCWWATPWRCTRQFSMTSRACAGRAARRLMLVLGLFRQAPGTTTWQVLRVLKRRVRRIGSRHYQRASSPIGAVDMGQLASLEPVSRSFGYDRGTPIDRYYIERFLKWHRGDIRGRALEIGDASYCRRFDSGITHQDILHISPDAPEATIRGDLVQP